MCMYVFHTPWTIGKPSENAGLARRTSNKSTQSVIKRERSYRFLIEAFYFEAAPLTGYRFAVETHLTCHLHEFRQRESYNQCQTLELTVSSTYKPQLKPREPIAGNDSDKLQVQTFQGSFRSFQRRYRLRKFVYPFISN